jgi:hypothetical protein
LLELDKLSAWSASRRALGIGIKRSEKSYSTQKMRKGEIEIKIYWKRQRCIEKCE